MNETDTYWDVTQIAHTQNMTKIYKNSCHLVQIVDNIFSNISWVIYFGKMKSKNRW